MLAPAEKQSAEPSARSSTQANVVQPCPTSKRNGPGLSKRAKERTENYDAFMRDMELIESEEITPPSKKVRRRRPMSTTHVSHTVTSDGQGDGELKQGNTSTKGIPIV